MKNRNRVALGLRIRKDVHEQLQERCVKTGRSMAQEAEHLLEITFLAEDFAGLWFMALGQMIRQSAQQKNDSETRIAKDMGRRLRGQI